MTACLDGIGKTMEQRRIDAGIELHTANKGVTGDAEGGVQ
jgi:hypothetical protein